MKSWLRIWLIQPWYFSAHGGDFVQESRESFVREQVYGNEAEIMNRKGFKELVHEVDKFHQQNLSLRYNAILA